MTNEINTHLVHIQEASDSHEAKVNNMLHDELRQDAKMSAIKGKSRLTEGPLEIKTVNKTPQDT